ncbi:hypothetical protein Tsubulata_027048 [Turnera subulata]|uniref:Snurportin-1 n=1 Tax=Turnera subulata TaxID=218843 RepID=A0A9Q0JBV8_9ROSI|nr:hypothetical protein Tsubulata_027048 [Turnera subulata]
MAPHDVRRPFKRAAISDQQRRRDLTLERQAQSRRDAQNQARCLASTILSLQSQSTEPEHHHQNDIELAPETEQEEHVASSKDLDVRHAARLRGAEARKWFAGQLMLPEWMIDVPDRLSQDWHAHYQTGNTPLALVWKDQNCSQYVIDTDNKGQVPAQQQVVLELQNDGQLITSDDPPVSFGCADSEFIQKSGLSSGDLLRFAIGDGGLSIVDGKLEKADLQYLGRPNRARAFADSYSKVMFQHTVRHCPLKFEDLLSSIHPSDDQQSKPCDIEMTG